MNTRAERAKVERVQLAAFCQNLMRDVVDGKCPVGCVARWPNELLTPMSLTRDQAVEAVAIEALWRNRFLVGKGCTQSLINMEVETQGSNSWAIADPVFLPPVPLLEHDDFYARGLVDEGVFLDRLRSSPVALVGTDQPAYLILRTIVKAGVYKMRRLDGREVSMVIQIPTGMWSMPNPEWALTVRRDYMKAVAILNLGYVPRWMPLLESEVVRRVTETKLDMLSVKLSESKVIVKLTVSHVMWKFTVEFAQE